MKAIVTFNCHLQFDVDDDMRDRLAPVSQQIEQLKNLLTEGGCEHAEISGYHFVLVSEI